MKNVPDIRFKGFEDEWISVLFSNIAKISRGLTYSPSCINTKGVRVLRSSNIVEGNFCIFDNDIFVNEKSVNIPFAHNKDILITAANGSTNLVGKHCLINISNEEKFVHGGFMLIAKSSEPEFLHYSMFSDWYRRFLRVGTTGGNGAICNLNKIELAKNKIFVSKYKCEKTKISNLFVNLDNNIKTLHKKIASLKQLKSACLISMFPQQGETVPRVRFKGFDGEWKNIKLKDILVERHEMSTITFFLPQLSFTISEGVIKPENRKTNKRDFLIKDKKNKKYIVTKIGDIIYNPANVVFGAIHRNNLCDGVVSPIYKIFYSEEDTKFVECIVRNPAFINKLTLYTEGTVTKLKTLKPESFLDMEVCITNDKAEQHQIASYFRQLDIQISEQEKRLEKLKQIKAACLDKMFV